MENKLDIKEGRFIGPNDHTLVCLKMIIGQIDQIVSFELAEQSDELLDGNMVIFVSAGIGYEWGATTVRWGKDESHERKSRN